MSFSQCKEFDYTFNDSILIGKEMDYKLFKSKAQVYLSSFDDTTFDYNDSDFVEILRIYNTICYYKIYDSIFLRYCKVILTSSIYFKMDEHLNFYLCESTSYSNKFNIFYGDINQSNTIYKLKSTKEWLNCDCGSKYVESHLKIKCKDTIKLKPEK